MDAYGVLIELMKDRQQPARIRLEASREVLNRHWGKPRQSVELTDGRGPLVSPAAQARMLSNPAAAELVAELDAILTAPEPKV